MPTHAHALSARPETPRRIPALLLLLTALFGSLLVSTSSPAEATTPGSAYVQEAARHNGKPYAAGAVGPYRFDCSGFTLYVFSRFGKRLPHSSSAQYSAVEHIATSAKQVGDLIFFRTSSGSIGHVGIYAGNGRMWDSPKAGDHVRLRAMYSTNYVVGRI
ncbi:MAG: C40 family peptidase [Frankiaceae bacterium]|nr:C40 family peptidase [Frankiaceae bacterium]